MHDRIKDQVDRLTKYDMSYYMRRMTALGAVLARYEATASAFIEEHPEANLKIDEDGVVLTTQDRSLAASFMLAFAGPDGEWKKEVENQDSSYYTPSVAFYREEEHPVPLYEWHKLVLKVTGCPPPPGCEIVEEEVEVPAHKRTVKKLICHGAASQSEAEVKI